MRLLPRATRIATNIGPGCASAKISQLFNFRSKIPRPLGSTSVNVLKWACSKVGLFSNAGCDTRRNQLVSATSSASFSNGVI
jgi:hypothetical protein